MNILSSVLKLILPQNLSRKLGIRTLLDDRIEAVLPYIEGDLLDIGCGTNQLVLRYGKGKGINPDKEDISGGEYDTITMLATLNYLPFKIRNKVLFRVRTMLLGYLIITCVNPLVGFLKHMITGERPAYWGFWESSVIQIMEKAGFEFVETKTFTFGLNRLYVFK